MGSQTLGRDNSLSLVRRRGWTERWPHDRKVGGHSRPSSLVR